MRTVVTLVCSLVFALASKAVLGASSEYPDVSDGVLSRQASDISKGLWVTANGNDLLVAGKPLHPWGYNIQAGPFKTYPELDRLVDRLSFSGANAVRLWPSTGTFFLNGKWAISKKTDGSALDRYDYLFSRLAESGIYIHSTSLHAVDEAYVASTDDAEVRAIFAGAKGGRFRELHGIAPYLSDSYRSLLKRHIQFVLDHTNPYTGRRYAEEPAVSTWELANESSFVHCMLDSKCVERLPAKLKELLQLKFRQSEGESGVNAFEAISGKGELYERYKRFVISLFQSGSNDLRADARAQAKAGVGVAVQPFSFASQAGAPLLAARYAASTGDVAEVSAYQNTLTNDSKSLGYPFQPLAVRGPLFYNFNLGGVDGKPTIVYETSFFRPNPYRAEWGGAMATFARVQGWSGAFLYFFGQPNIIYGAEGLPEGYGIKALPEPRFMDESKGFNVYYGLHHGGDEVAIASWLIGSFVFRNLSDAGIRTEQISVSERVLGKAANGIQAQTKCAVANSLDTTALESLSTQRRMRLAFKPASTDQDTVATCPTCECTVPSKELRPLDGVAWNRLAGTLQWTQKALKGVVGFARGRIDLGDGFSLELNSPEFSGVVVARSSLAQDRYWVVVAGQSENTGFSFRPDAVDRSSPYGAIAGVTAAGDAPVKVHRVSGELSLPSGTWKIEKYDFQGRRFAQVVGQSLLLRQDEPLFLAVLTRQR